MDSQSIKEIFNELYSHLERLETQNTAILQFLKEKKRVTDKQLAPYLEQAGNASNVKWRAARVRMEYLLAQAPEETKPDEKTKKESVAPPEVEQKSPEVERKTSSQEEQEQAAEGSGERDGSKKQKKAASDDDTGVAHSKEEQAAQIKNEQQPEQEHPDSGRPAAVQAEPAHESGGEKKEGGKKVA